MNDTQWDVDMALSDLLETQEEVDGMNDAKQWEYDQDLSELLDDRPRCDACDKVCLTLSGDSDRAVFCCNCRLKDAPAFYVKDRCEECEKR